MVTLRAGAPSDAERLSAMIARELEREISADSIRPRLVDHPSRVAENGEEIVGFVYCQRFAPDLLEVANVLVTRSQRDRGLGSRLLTTLEEAVTPEIGGLVLVNSDLSRGPGGRRPDALYVRCGYRLVFETAVSRVFAKRLR